MLQKHCLLILFLASSLAYSATYYVSFSGGSDSATAVQAQNQATPWKTIAKINAQAFAPGDTILFKRGDSWEGGVTVSSSGTSGNPITYSAYGTGENPKIKGTVRVASAWTNAGGNIYQADVSQDINQLFLNGRPLTLARYPNRGYLTMDDTLGPTTLKCALLTSVDWTGAMIHVRTAHWTLASKRVVSCNTGQKTLTLQTVPEYGLKPGWGFFINNKREALDTAGEWYYDSIAHRLYVWTPNGDSPANYIVEGSTYQTGFSITGKIYITINGFSIIGHTSYGIHGNNAANLIVDGNTISHADAIGVYFNGSSHDNTVRNNIIESSNRYGMLNYGASLVFSGNTIRQIALIADLSKSGMGDECCSGLAFEGHGNTLQIRNNVIDSIGYIGIRTFDMNNLIENNLISHCCLSKDDGAGIYSGWQSDAVQNGSAGTIIRRNIVFSTQSANAGTPDKGYTPGEGIYLDDHGHDITIAENTTFDCSNHGIFIHNNKNTRVYGNVCYNNRDQLGLAEDAIIGPGYVGNNTVTNNILYSLSDTQACMRTTSPYTSTYLANSDSNYYCNPYSDMVLFYNASSYSLDSWKTAKGLDAHSKISRASLSPWEILDTTGTNLVVNGAFAANISQWSYWPSPVKISWDNSAGLDGGCMKVLYTDDSQAASCLVYPASFGLTKGQAYLLRFSAISNKAGALQAIIRMAHDPWGDLGMSKSFMLGSGRKDFSAVFFADSTDAQSRVDFSNTKADSLYWLDNVSIAAVTVAAADPREKSKLFYNATQQNQVISLLGKRYRDLDGNTVLGSITLGPFMSRILVADTGASAIANPFQRNNGKPAIAVLLHAGGRSLRIAMMMDRQDHLTVSMHDFSGRCIAVLFDGIAQKGIRKLDWNGMSGSGTRISRGNYLARIQIGNRVYIRRLADAR
jgi:parallel beta-helix repeat protein